MPVTLMLALAIFRRSDSDTVFIIYLSLFMCLSISFFRTAMIADMMIGLAMATIV